MGAGHQAKALLHAISTDERTVEAMYLRDAIREKRYFQILWMSSDQAASFFSPSVNVTLAITSWISSCWLSLRQVFEAESANL